ncbi:MAG: hypothetical protein ASARMPRED_008449 [Alectoria sarmentosa]|nr:MAG: hypothetical protein ASARMPRED_008449 [Alectoria sarmentosa]
MNAPVRKRGRWPLLVSFLSAFYLLSSKSALPEPHLSSRSLLTSAQWYESDVEKAVVSKSGETEVHLPDNMVQNWNKGSRIRQASVMIGDQHKLIFEPCMETHLDHARKWGYPTHILKHDLSGKAGWIRLVLEKSLHILSLLVSEMAKASHERADWVIWLDPDAIVVNNNIPWTTFLPREDSFSDIHFIASRDWNDLNYGVFFVQVNEWSINFLTQVATFPKSRPGIDTSEDVDIDAIWWVLSQSENQDNVIYQPRSWYNGYDLGDQGVSEMYEGNMQVHLVGVDSRRRKEAAVTWWLSKIEKSPQKMHMTLEASGYPEKVQMFWEILKTARELLQESQKRSYKMRLNLNEVKDAEEELQNFIRFAASDMEGMITAKVMLRKAHDDAEIKIAEDHRTSMVASIALNDARLT